MGYANKSKNEMDINANAGENKNKKLDIHFPTQYKIRFIFKPKQ